MVKDVCRKATAAMARIRRIGERKFADDFCARMLMFNKMIKSI